MPQEEPGEDRRAQWLQRPSFPRARRSSFSYRWTRHHVGEDRRSRVRNPPPLRAGDRGPVLGRGHGQAPSGPLLAGSARRGLHVSASRAQRRSSAMLRAVARGVRENVGFGAGARGLVHDGLAGAQGWKNSPLFGGRLEQVRGFIQLRTNLEVADNSGARRVQCIKVMKGSNAARIGDTVMASVKDAQPRGKVKKGEVVTCVVVRAATQKLRRDGSEIRFDKNAVVLVNKQGEPIGTRIFGPVPHELRRRKLVKILTLAEQVV